MDENPYKAPAEPVEALPAKPKKWGLAAWSAIIGVALFIAIKLLGWISF